MGFNNKLIFCLILITILLSVLVLAGARVEAAAEPYLRVSKGGVIYYYFSHRGEKRAKPVAGPSGRTKTAPPAARKLSAPELEPLIREAAGNHNLPSPLIKAVIRVESNFHPGATSPKGAQGLMQLMPQTADSLQVANPYDIQENIGGGTRYLRMLLEKYNYNLPLALAAYNAGPQRVDRCQRVPSIKETQDFVRQVCDQFLKYARE
jgi:soluble lytic murein transglycosylase-like protein